MAKQHYIYLSARKMDHGQVPEGFTVYNDFGHSKTIICGQLMSKAYGLLSYDQKLTEAAMDANSLTNISDFPEPILKGLGAFL